MNTELDNLNFDNMLDYIIELHANFHSGKQGLNNTAFKEELHKLIDKELERVVRDKFGPKE